MHTTEEWRPVVGYEALYEVSNIGRIRSIPRFVASGNGATRFVPQHIRKLTLGGIYKRPQVCLMGSTLNVHVLVAAAFIGPRPDGLWVCHNNGDPTDNRVENLRYDTPASNSADRTMHGNNALANRTHCNKGHAFTPDNIGKKPKGQGRRCLTCHREYERNRKANAA